MSTIWKRLIGRKRAATAGEHNPRVSKWHAVSVISNVTTCAAAMALRDTRHLAADAPHLPLRQCTIPQECQCRFAHYDDRRSFTQRAPYQWRPNDAHVAGRERRRGRGRRASDLA